MLNFVFYIFCFIQCVFPQNKVTQKEVDEFINSFSTEQILNMDLKTAQKVKSFVIKMPLEDVNSNRKLFNLVNIAKKTLNGARADSVSLYANPSEQCLDRLGAIKDLNLKKKIAKECIETSNKSFISNSSMENIFLLVKSYLASYRYNFMTRQELSSEFWQIYKNHVKSFIDAKTYLGKKDYYILFDIMYTLYINSLDDAYSKAFTRLFHKYSNKYSYTKDHIKDYYELMVTSRDFKESKAVKQKYKEIKLESVPEIKILRNKKNDARLYNVLDKSLELVSASSVKKEIKLVVIADPTCSACIKAVNYIKKSEKLNKMFSQDALFLKGQGLLGFEDVKGWNKKYPKFKIHIVYKESEWPNDIEWLSTPGFFFIKNGKVVLKKIGWCQKEKMEDILNQGFELIKN